MPGHGDVADRENAQHHSGIDIGGRGGPGSYPESHRERYVTAHRRDRGGCGGHGHEHHIDQPQGVRFQPVHVMLRQRRIGCGRFIVSPRIRSDRHRNSARALAD